MELLSEPWPERMANLVFLPETGATPLLQKNLTVGVGCTLQDLAGRKIHPTHEIYLILDDREFALPVSAARALSERLMVYADSADALNKESNHG